MRRILLWGLVALLVVSAIGIAGVLLPPTATQAAAPVDRACMRALKPDYSFERRKRMCRVRVRGTSVGPAQLGGPSYFRWKVGNVVWQFAVETTYEYTQGAWRVYSLLCYEEYAYLVSVDITKCGVWRVGEDKAIGATYTVGYGPVTRGGRTFFLVRPDGTKSGLVIE